MKVEEVIQFLGFGRFHKQLILVGIVLHMCTSTMNFIVVLFTFTPNHRCSIPGIENDTYHPVSESHRELLNLTIPADDYGKCFTYDLAHLRKDREDNLTSSVTSKMWYTSSRTQEKKRCDSWVYDRTVITNNAVTEFDLVCDSSILTAHGQMVFFVGILVGSFVFGVIGDVFGRKKACLAAVVIGLVCSISTKWTTNFTTFMVLRFVIGAGCVGTYANMLVLIFEFVETSKRVVASFYINIGGSVGVVIMIGIAYFVRDWKDLSLVIFLPFILQVTFIWLLPESVRWSLKKKKIQEAESIFLKIAKEHKVELPEDFLDPELEEEKTESIVNVFTTPVLLKRFVILMINWIGLILVYYGLTLNTGNLGGSLYVNFLASIAIEIPGEFAVILLINRIGRKSLYILLMMVGGAACIATLFPVTFNREGLQWLTLTLATVGKFSGSAAFSVMYMYTPELFPTTLRMSALGSLSAIARLGGILAPYIVELANQIGGDISVAIPLLVFGGYAVTCGLLCVMLPETKNARLPETVDDVKRNRGAEEKEYAEIEIAESMETKWINSAKKEMSKDGTQINDTELQPADIDTDN